MGLDSMPFDVMAMIVGHVEYVESICALCSLRRDWWENKERFLQIAWKRYAEREKKTAVSSIGIRLAHVELEAIVTRCPDYVFASYVHFHRGKYIVVDGHDEMLQHLWMEGLRLNGSGVLTQLARQGMWRRFQTLEQVYPCRTDYLSAVCPSFLMYAMSTNKHEMVDYFLGLLADAFPEKIHDVVLRNEYSIENKLHVFENAVEYNLKESHLGHLLSPPEHAILNGEYQMVRVYMKHRWYSFETFAPVWTPVSYDCYNNRRVHHSFPMIQWAVMFDMVINIRVMREIFRWCVYSSCGKLQFLVSHHDISGVSHPYESLAFQDTVEVKPCVLEILLGWYSHEQVRTLVITDLKLSEQEQKRLVELLMEKYGESSHVVSGMQRALGMCKLPVSGFSMMRSAKILMSLSR